MTAAEKGRWYDMALTESVKSENVDDMSLPTSIKDTLEIRKSLGEDLNGGGMSRRRLSTIERPAVASGDL